MGEPSSGGSYIPRANYNRTGATDLGGTYAGATLTANAQAGTPPNSAVAVTELGAGFMHQTLLTITNLPMTLVDANVGGGAKIYTFPEGNITVLGATATMAETTTSALASTLNASAVLSVGVGSVITTTQGGGTVTTTEQDIVNAFSVTASATIAVAGAAASGKITATTMLKYDGTTTPVAIYLNCQVPTATDIDADATTTWSGTVRITWVHNGDY